mgnify:CR=1 FL=1
MALIEVSIESLREPYTPTQLEIQRKISVARDVATLLGLEITVNNIAEVSDQLDITGYPRTEEELNTTLEAVSGLLEARRNRAEY